MEIIKIGVIGHFGGNEKFTDGQTVKTITIYNALKEKKFFYPLKVDTYLLKKNIFKFIYQWLNCIFFSKKVIILLSLNGRKVFFPILYILAKFLKKEIYHYAIGGRLANEVKEKKYYKKYIKSFKGNWMESMTLVENLKELGVKNAKYIPNFKAIPILTRQEIKENIPQNNYFCIFSRITKKKGIIDAIEAIEKVSVLEKIDIKLDIYGPIEEEFKNEFYSTISGKEKICEYKGIIHPEKSVEVLKKYFCLLFPTHWRHEGIPGTIVDSLSAGVPIIARCWQYCKEMIEDKKTGYIYEFDSPEKLTETILYAIKNRERTLEMRYSCIEAARKYSKENVIEKILEEMEIEKIYL